MSPYMANVEMAKQKALNKWVLMQSKYYDPFRKREYYSARIRMAARSFKVPLVATIAIGITTAMLRYSGVPATRENAMVACFIGFIVCWILYYLFSIDHLISDRDHCIISRYMPCKNPKCTRLIDMLIQSIKKNRQYSKWWVIPEACTMNKPTEIGLDDFGEPILKVLRVDMLDYFDFKYKHAHTGSNVYLREYLVSKYDRANKHEELELEKLIFEFI